MEVIERVQSRNGMTLKYLQKIADGFVVETSYINTEKKHVICFSTQVGCAIGCTFCASGLREEGKYKRSLSATEMFEECLNVVQEIDFSKEPKSLLFSCMGEGEPFLNFDNCAELFLKLSKAEWPVPVRIAISTSGIRPDLIRKLSTMDLGVPLKLQVSIHGPDDETRRKLVPNTKSLQDILEATRVFRSSGKSVDLNYVLCDGINDRLEHAQLLAQILGPGWHVKFNELNPNIGSPFKPSCEQRVHMFVEILESNGITTEIFRTDEGNIKAGCGQLSYHYISARP